MNTHHPPPSGEVSGVAGALDSAGLTVEELARLLTAVGRLRVPPEQIQADLDAGAPGKDGDGVVRINLVHYAAWLLREVQTR